MKNRSYGSLFGNRQKGMESLQDELQQKVGSLQSELELNILRRECKKYELKAQELQERINSYEEKERIIADVLLNAQSEARRVENQARERVRQMEARVYEDIRQKLVELADLRARMDDFMEEVTQMLHSLEYALNSSNSTHLQNQVLFTSTDFGDTCEDSCRSVRDDSPPDISLNDLSDLKAFQSFRPLNSLNLNPDIKLQPLRVVARKPNRDQG